NAKQIWQTILERLRAKVTSAVFTTWFQETAALSFQDGVFVVSVPTTFAKTHLEGRFREPLCSMLADITGSKVDIQFVVAKEPSGLGQQLPKEMDARAPKRSYRLGKGRIATALRERRLTDIAASAMNSMVSVIPQAYRGVKHSDVPQHDLSPDGYLTSTESSPAGLTLLPLVQLDQESISNVTDRSVFLNTHDSTEGTGTIPSLSSGLVLPGLLNPRYTFGAFIVGKSNQLAHAASLAVSENPGHIYNPLFLYGGVGLGKTHLMHAIGHAGELAGLNVLYVTSEKFTNEIINAIRFQKTEEFRAKYRQIDILLVDDIQFIAGKESTEEEFFHTFNSLYDANKQIVVTSDRPPKAINSLQDRLRSRFEWGLLADVQPPEYEHRLAILRSKCESIRFTVPASIIEYIARPQCTSVRELEGALNRVIAYATLHDAPLTVHIASQALQHIYDTKPPATIKYTVDQVLECVCRYYEISPDTLRGKQRDRDIVWPRQVAMYLMREQTSAPLLQIGAALGGRDHTTVMHGWEKVSSEVNNSELVRQEIAAVLEILRNPLL
ncbi:MAG TPA: chromosomal replication initiator protein DnaA, partial [Ktedonobacteraceae bacterium]|nr:chromosomal replication initiator protein DnaA [Ktedonobacteraceae bacterium]